LGYSTLSLTQTPRFSSVAGHEQCGNLAGGGGLAADSSGNILL